MTVSKENQIPKLGYGLVVDMKFELAPHRLCTVRTRTIKSSTALQKPLSILRVINNSLSLSVELYMSVCVSEEIDKQTRNRMLRHGYVERRLEMNDLVRMTAVVWTRSRHVSSYKYAAVYVVLAVDRALSQLDITGQLATPMSHESRQPTRQLTLGRFQHQSLYVLNAEYPNPDHELSFSAHIDSDMARESRRYI